MQWRTEMVHVIEIPFTCPVCQKKVAVLIESEKVVNSPTNPVPIVVTHGTPEHAVTVFVDREYRVRATSGSNIVQRIEDAEESRSQYTKKHIPIPVTEKVSLSGLDNTQITIIALTDGKRSVGELARIMDVSEIRVKIICEQLVRMDKLETVRVVIGKQ